MTARSRRRSSNAPRPELARQEQQQKRKPAQKSSALEGTGIPEWKWTTTPVALAFAVGGLLGTYLGLISAFSIDDDNILPFVVVQAGFALLLGAALGRVIRRWLAIRKVERIRAGP